MSTTQRTTGGPMRRMGARALAAATVLIAVVGLLVGCTPQDAKGSGTVDVREGQAATLTAGANNDLTVELPASSIRVGLASPYRRLRRRVAPHLPRVRHSGNAVEGAPDERRAGRPSASAMAPGLLGHAHTHSGRGTAPMAGNHVRDNVPRLGDSFDQVNSVISGTHPYTQLCMGRTARSSWVRRSPCWRCAVRPAAGG